MSDTGQEPRHFCPQISIFPPKYAISYNNFFCFREIVLRKNVYLTTERQQNSKMCKHCQEVSISHPFVIKDLMTE